MKGTCPRDITKLVREGGGGLFHRNFFWSENFSGEAGKIFSQNL